MQEDTLRSVDLHAILAKATKEADMSDGDQPLFVDEGDETIKCRWCTLFKGSQELKHINQHTSKAASHQRARRKLLGGGNDDDRGENQLDIGSFLCS